MVRVGANGRQTPSEKYVEVCKGMQEYVQCGHAEQVVGGFFDWSDRCAPRFTLLSSTKHQLSARLLKTLIGSELQCLFQLVIK